MSTIYHNRSVIFQILLIAWVLGSSSIVIGQSPEIRLPAADSSTEPLPPIPAPSPYRQPSIRKFTFKHAKAGDVLKLLQQLEPEQKESSGFAVDERTNSFLFQLEDDQQARTFEELCTLLDEEANVPSHVGNGVSISIPVNGQQPQVFSFSMGFERGESLESLKQRYNELEQQAHQLADKLKQSKSPNEPELTELKTAVRKSFEARQALHRAELADLVQRMKSMQQSIDIRDKLADKVVQRRVEDLLNPNLKWDMTRTGTESTRSIAKEDSISSNTIKSSQEMQAALQGTWNVRAFQAGDQGDDRLSQVVIRGDLLLMHTIVNGKVLGVSPWKLVWPNAEMPYEIGAIWDPNSNTESEPFMPGRIAHDGKSFQLAFGENPISAICPGENATYIDCVRANIDDRSTATANTEAAADSSLLSDSTPIFNTPQELLDAVEQRGKSGSYEDFVTLFNDEGVRDLAGSLLMSAMMQTSMDELARQQTTGGLSEVDPGTVAVRKVLQRWLPQSLSADQQEYVGKGISAMMSSIGGVSPDHAALKEFVISMRKSVEGIPDHRNFCVELMQAYEKLTTKPFVYFGKADEKNEWKISQFGDRAIATLIDGSPGMATTITLLQASGDWRISSLFDDLLNVVQPNIEAPSAAAPEQSNSKMITRRYSVGSFVTESFFAGRGNYDTKEVYEKYETDIEQSLAELARTVTATCTQPPKFVQVLSSSRCLLIGHTEAGHQEIVNFMSDIGINNDRIRLRGVEIEITKDDVKSLGFDWTQGVIQLLSSEKAEKLRTFQKNKKSESENSLRDFSFVAMDEAIQSGTRTYVKTSEVGLQFPFAARIVPGTKKVQLRMDFHDSSGGVEFFAPRIQTLSDGQSVMLEFGDDLFWLVTADIVQDAIVGAETNDNAASNPLPPSTPALEMQQLLQGEWDVKVMGFSPDMHVIRPYQAVVRGQLFLLQCMEDGKVIGTSTWKMIWPEADHPDVVDIVWDPNNSSDEHFCPGRIACDGKSFQVAWRSDDSTSGPAIRPTEISSGDGISYFECVRKQPVN